MQLDNPLWRYALKVYSHPSVERSCLAAQDLGLHVNTLLLCCWLATRDEYYQSEHYASVLTLWRDPVLSPLRRVRYQVRAMCQEYPELESCYQHLKQSELAAEQVDIALLWQLYLLQPSPVAVDSSAENAAKALAQKNIANYLKAVEMDSTATAVACSNQLVDAVIEHN
ncbi:TIGR02444 family protein [Nitrincola sp.]|uniref:TIGR02444 family protein n=1 Tax=Nitrincola sp. TaxID=1926584 RepID=UPI003A8F9475